MRSRIGLLAVRLLVPGVLLGCTAPSTEPVADPDSRSDARVEVRAGEAFTLAAGEEAELAGADLRVRFIEVAADNRCPVDVDCVWEGDAEVVVETVHGGEERAWVLHTAGPPAGGPQHVALDGYTLELVGLEPSPHTEYDIPQESYRARLRLVESG